MKVIIQVPCFNEETSLPVTLAGLPRKLPFVDEVEWMVIDDGSSDRTVEVARALGVDHIVCLPHHRGLAAAFQRGLSGALARGADIVVNTDADNQYRGEDIAALIRPIVFGDADMVVGARPIRHIPHFSPLKRMLQLIGSWVVRQLSGTQVPDARSGFRAFSRWTAARLEVHSRYTYTMETLIQAGQEGLRIVSIPVQTNPDLRPSRLIRSIPSDLGRSSVTILASFLRYRPLPAFLTLGAALAGWATAAGFGAAAVPMALAAATGGWLAHLAERNRRLLRDLHCEQLLSTPTSGRPVQRHLAAVAELP